MQATHIGDPLSDVQSASADSMEPLTEAERTIVLRALFELAVTASSFDDEPDRDDRTDHLIRPAVIAALVRKLGGNPDVPLFGADDPRD